VLDEIWLALLLLVTISGMGMSSTLSTVHKEASFVGGVYSRSLMLLLMLLNLPILRTVEFRLQATCMFSFHLPEGCELL
jgi:hypothetical protein